jgi:hypothetical protein
MRRGRSGQAMPCEVRSLSAGSAWGREGWLVDANHPSLVARRPPSYMRVNALPSSVASAARGGLTIDSHDGLTFKIRSRAVGHFNLSDVTPIPSEVDT